MLMLQLEHVLLNGGVGRSRHPFYSGLERSLPLLTLPLTIQVRAGRHLLRNSDLRQARFLTNTHSRLRNYPTTSKFLCAYPVPNLTIAGQGQDD